MKKNGFTLIELIASITLLAIIALIAFPVILNSLTSGQAKVDEGVKKVVESAAEKYANDNDRFTDVSVCFLAQHGYISPSFFEKNKKILEHAMINISDNGTKYNYTFDLNGFDGECDLNRGEDSEDSGVGTKTVYAWNTNEVTIGTSTIGDLESTKTQEPYYTSEAGVLSASGYTFFNKYTVVDGTITEVYVCQTFGILSSAVCVKQSTDGSSYNYNSLPGNWSVLNVLNSNSSFTGASGSCTSNQVSGQSIHVSRCNIGNLQLQANSAGGVLAGTTEENAKCRGIKCEES